MIMKTKKVFKILCVVFAVLFACTVIGGIVYGIIKDGERHGNSNSAVVGYADELPITGIESNSNARSTFNEVAPLAEGNTNFTGNSSATFTVRIFKDGVNTGEDFFPITLISTYKLNPRAVSVGSTFSEIGMTNVFKNGIVDCNNSRTFGCAYDKDGNYLFVRNFDGCKSFPLVLTPGLSSAKLILELTYDYEEAFQNVYNEGHEAGYTEGHTAGVTEGHEAGYTEGHTAGVAEGHEAGYNEGHEAGVIVGVEAGFNAGQEVGYNRGHEAGYNEGHVDGKNLGESTAITNPINSLLNPAHDFMNTKFFGDLTYASIFNVMLFVAVALIFIKMFSGG